MLCSHNWAFYIQGSWVSISCCGTWSGYMHKVYIALQELLAVSLMLCKMAFQLSNKMVNLQSDNIVATAYLCNQGGTAYSSFSD